MRDETPRNVPELELSDQDVTEAMQEIPGYLDITPGDFRELYRVALSHAWVLKTPGTILSTRFQCPPRHTFETHSPVAPIGLYSISGL